MKKKPFLSLFAKTPAHQRFQFQPRYFDPQKEELDNRVERIKNQLAKERGEVAETTDNPSDYRSRMVGAIQAARKRNSKKGGQVVIVRLAILLFLTLIIMAFITWGNQALYLLIGIIPIYLWMRFKS
jgi:Flp pilus assembly protein TadB